MNLSIQSKLNNVISFAELEPIVKEAKEDISFCGVRYIYVPGYEGSLHIDALAEKVMELVRKNFDFDEQERSVGQRIASKITLFFKASLV